MIRQGQQAWRPTVEQGWFGPKQPRYGPVYGTRTARGARGLHPGLPAAGAKEARREEIRARAMLQAMLDDEYGDTHGRRQGRTRGGREITNRKPRPAGGGVIARNRRCLLPHLIALTVLLCGVLTHVSSTAVGLSGVAAATSGLALATVGAAVIVALRKAKRLPSGWMAWSVLLATCASAWLAVAVAAGLSWPLLAALLVLDYLFGMRWWARHRHPLPEGKPTHAASTGVGDEGRIPAAWRETVGAKDGMLAGSRLVNAESAAHGTVYTLQLKPGKQALSDVLAAIGRIASGLRTPVEQLLAEAHPSRDPSQVRFQVITASPVDKPVFFTEPRITNGCVVLGPYADGVTEALWRLYTHKSMWGGMVIGGTGSGKSRLLELIALVATHTRHTYVIHVDGQDGQSCPLLWQHAAERAGQDDAEAMLSRLEAMQRYRQHAAGEAGKAGFRPTPEYPGILVIVDEAHAVISQNNAVRWAKIAREARKVGIAVVMGDQDGSLETFKKDVLRSSLMAGNCVGLRTDSRSQGQILGDGKFNLRDLPKIPGFGYTIATDDTGRTAPYRGQWLPDAEDAEELASRGEALPEGLRLIEDWYPSAPKAALDTGTLEAGDRVDRTRGRRAEPVAASELPPAPSPAAVPTVALPAMSESQAKVLAALGEGADRPTAIAEQVGLTRQQVTTLLGQLVDADQAVRSGYGRYAVAA
ncbi:MAG: hypothetical protein ACRDRL_07215 [Sciscionella sp.]